ncbi:MAG: 50S ribosomal protein L21 [Anaerolineae bacterium]
MAYAVIETGGKQYRVQEGQVLKVERLPQETGEALELDRVLLVSKEGDVRIGRPLVEGARVRATVVGEGKNRKRLTMKYRPKQRYRRKLGHRQPYTLLRIEEIVA